MKTVIANSQDQAKWQPLGPADGARWQRVDLHLHTPGVASFVCPPGAELRTAAGRTDIVARYVDQLLKAKITLGALTDYNGIRQEWFLPIADRANQKGITLFPGAEMSFKHGKYGLHVLAIFDRDTRLDEINSFLVSMDQNSTTLLRDDGSHEDIDPRENIVSLLFRIKKRFNCILIFPHPDQTNGFLKSMGAQDAANLVNSVLPDAIEHCPHREIQRLESTNILPKTFWSNFAFVEFSDPKSIDQIGTRTLPDGKPRSTYLKLSSVELDALRLALHDPKTRLVLHGPPTPIHARIRAVKITGSGFLGNLIVNWNDDLNVVIGGRGAGKSALLETLRYVFDAPPIADEEYRNSLVRHALGSGGKVELVLERPVGNSKSEVYLVSRVFGEDPIVRDHDSRAKVEIPPSDLLGTGGGPTIFGQREIYAVSQSEQYRLALLDQLIGDEAKQRAEAVQQGFEYLRTNARSITDAQARLIKRDEHRQRLKAVQHEIDVYEKNKASEKLRVATQLRSDNQQLKTALSNVASVEAELSAAKDSALGPLTAAVSALGRAQSPQKGILEEAAVVIGELQKSLEQSFRQAIQLIAQAKGKLDQIRKKWEDALLPLEEEINRIKRETQLESLDPDRLLKLAETKAQLLPLIESLDRAEAQLKELLQKRDELKTSVRQRRHEENTLRRQRAEQIGALLRGRLRLNIQFKGNKEDFKKRLSTLCKGSRVSADAIDRLVSMEAIDGLLLAEAVKSGASEIQKKFGLTPGMADLLVQWFTTDESRLFELETLMPADSLQVELKVDEDYRPIERLSAGQRATSILLLLFALEGRVLILDQPEDDLDNRFVYEDIVQILRDQKGLTAEGKRRQVIAATHNANIPVLGDAELVLAMESREDRAHILGRSSIDDTKTREMVKTIMEGGEEAFRRRAEKYGGLLPV